MNRLTGILANATIAIGIGFMILCPSQATIGSNENMLGSWIGEAEMGGGVLRLVFNLKMVEGNLTGTVDSPDKGIEGIPLSRVDATGDSVLFEVSAAQANYRGRLSARGEVIDGIWREGETSFTMRLVRIRTKGTRAQPQLSNIPEYMTARQSSQHFELYSSDIDRGVLGDITATLEKSFDRVSEHLQTEFAKKIRVYVYPDIETFHRAIHLANAPDWVVGAAGINEIKMVSPLKPGKAHTSESLGKAVVHELVHVAVLNARGKVGLVGLPKWLNEGYAFYEAGQMTPEMRESVRSHVDPRPSWSQLDAANSAEFGKLNGYAYSTTIIEFLVGRYGLENLIKLIKAPEELKTIYGVSQAELERGWLDYLQHI